LKNTKVYNPRKKGSFAIVKKIFLDANMSIYLND